MNSFIIKNKIYQWKEPEFILNSLFATTLFLYSLLINYFSAVYATLNSGPSIPDIILDNIPLINLSFLHYQMIYVAFFIIFAILIVKPDYYAFTLSALAVLISVRAIFVCLTHLGIPNGVLVEGTFFTQGGDLFFSGHVAIAYLLILIFWNVKYLRYFFIFILFVACFEVFFGKYHYSIDVLSAPFFAYTIYKVCQTKYFFKKYYENIV